MLDVYLDLIIDLNDYKFTRLFIDEADTIQLTSVK